MCPHVLLPSTSSSCHAVPAPQAGTAVAPAKVAAVQSFPSLSGQPAGVTQGLRTEEAVQPVGSQDGSDVCTSAVTSSLPPSNTPAAVVAALAAAAAASPSIAGALEGAFGGDALRPPLKSLEEPDAELAQTLLLKGYCLAEDTAGDADLTFPVDFHTPLNYEIYSFISQCINAQLKSGLAGAAVETSATDAASLRARDPCTSEDLTSAEPVILRAKQGGDTEEKVSWTAAVGAVEQWSHEAPGADLAESKTRDCAESRDNRGRGDSPAGRTKCQHKVKDSAARTAASGNQLLLPSQARLPPQRGQTVSALSSLPFPGQVVFSPSLSPTEKASCLTSEHVGPGTSTSDVRPPGRVEGQETSSTAPDPLIAAPLVTPPPQDLREALSSPSCCATSPSMPVTTGNESGPPSAVRAPPGLSGPDINTALLRAAFLGRVDIIEKCVQRGGDVCFADRVGRTALHYAAATGLEPIVRLLLSVGADRQINRRDRKSWTPLLIAVTKTHVACVRLLLERGANVSMTLCHRCAPCRSGSRTVAHNGAAPPVQRATATSDGVWDSTPVGRKNEKASEGQRERDAPTAQELRAAGTDGAEPGIAAATKSWENEATQPLQTWSAAIHFAAIKGSAEITKLLLEHGATVNDLDSDRRPPLHYAACRDNWQYVKWLVSRGARLDLVDVNGRSALHAAAMKGQLQNAQCILEGGDDLTALALLRTKDKWDITPAQLAKLHGQNAMYLLLRSYKEQLESALGEPGEGDAEMATDPDILLLNQTITEVLATGMQEVKKSKLERTVNRLGTVVCLKTYQKTMMIQGMGGMLVADGSRPKTPGGVFFTLLREMARHGEISREDLIYIDMEDGEAKKAQRRRARQQQAAAVAEPACQQASSQQRKRSPRQFVSRAVAPGTNRPTSASGRDLRRQRDEPLLRQKARRQNSTKIGRPQSSKAFTKVPTSAPSQQVSLNNPLSFLAAISAAGLPGPPSNFVVPAGQRPTSALSSKSNSGSSPRGGCPFTPLARAIDAESLTNSGGNTPQQCSMSAPMGGHVVVGGNPAVSSGGTGNNFYPYPVYPIYPFWPIGFPTPLSPPPLQGVTGRQVSNATTQGLSVQPGSGSSGGAVYGHGVGLPRAVAAAYGLSHSESGAVQRKNHRKQRQQQQHQANKEEKRVAPAVPGGQMGPGTQPGGSPGSLRTNGTRKASSQRFNNNVTKSSDAASSAGRDVETSGAPAVAQSVVDQSREPNGNRVWAPKKRGESTAAGCCGGGTRRGGADRGGRGGGGAGRRTPDGGTASSSQG